jgi:alpha-aminoadipate carrier protein LysW
MATVSTDPPGPVGSTRGEPPSSSCPECAATVVLDDAPALSMIVVCPDCTAELEVLALDPLELALAPEVEEDWGE